MAYHKKDDPSVYHECRNCTEGNNIEAENIEKGIPQGASLCKKCAELQQQGYCQYGTPTPAK